VLTGQGITKIMKMHHLSYLTENGSLNKLQSLQGLPPNLYGEKPLALFDLHLKSGRFASIFRKTY